MRKEIQRPGINVFRAAPQGGGDCGPQPFPLSPFQAYTVAALPSPSSALVASQLCFGQVLGREEGAEGVDRGDASYFTAIKAKSQTNMVSDLPKVM